MVTQRVHERRARKFVTVLGSLLCVGVVSLFLVDPTRILLQGNVVQSSGGIEGHAVIYGKVVNVFGHGVPGAEVLVLAKRKVGKKTVEVTAFKTTTNNEGLYRIEFKDTRPMSTYYGQFRIDHLKSNLMVLHVKTGHAYKVSAKEVSEHAFTIFPVGSY